MTDATVNDQQLVPQSRLDPQRLAWGVLLIAFAIFCLIAVVTGILVYYFLFQSTLSLDIPMFVGRGTISVNDQAERGGRSLLNSDELSTDFQSQATVFFYDPEREEQLVAAVTFRGETSAILRRAVRPRFEWGSVPYMIDLQEFSGELTVFVPKELDRGIRLTIVTGDGVLIDLGSSGQYAINASETQTRVVNRGGQVIMIPVGGNSGWDIPINAQGIVTANNPGEIALAPAYVNLLENSTFQDTLPVVDSGGQIQQVTQGWACTNNQNDLPRGTYQPEVKDGRKTLRLARGDNATAHGETRCLTYFGQGGLDVSEYTYLAVQTTMNINYQSLSVCGQDGSECPLMIEMDYVDEMGKAQRWIHGFYYYFEPTLTYPFSCSSCRQEHEKVNEKVWYTYDTGNLFSMFGPGERPKTIVNIQFYASGHQYDVYVGELALLGGRNGSEGPSQPGS